MPGWMLPAADDRERGSLSPMVAIVALASLIMIGLAYDGGQKAQATQRAIAIADEAARAGGQAVNPEGVIGQAPAAVDVAAAVAAAESYLNAAGVDGDISIAPGGRQLVVTTTIQIQTVFLGLIGIESMTVVGTGEADLVGS